MAGVAGAVVLLASLLVHEPTHAVIARRAGIEVAGINFAGVVAGLDALGVADIVVAVAWWLAAINLVLGLFNLLPGAPLDGGRFLRAYLWHRHGDATRAAVGAAGAGRIVAYALIGVGLLEFLAGSLVSGGVWMAFIGWFVLVAARDEEPATEPEAMETFEALGRDRRDRGCFSEAPLDDNQREGRDLGPHRTAAGTQ